MHHLANVLQWKYNEAQDLLEVNSSSILDSVLTGLCHVLRLQWASLEAQRLKCLPAMRETWVWSLGRKDSLEKEMATHSIILAWRIPWTEESGGLQSMGSQRVRHNWATSLSLSRLQWALPGGSAGKESAYNAGDLGSIPGLGRYLRKGNSYPL